MAATVRRLGAGLVFGLAAAMVPAAGAQQSGQDGGQDGSIVTEELAPLMPQGQSPPEAEVPGHDGFQPAPYRTPEVPVAPERIEPVETVQMPGARLRQLDKMTGRSETVEIAAGEEAMVDRLRVRLEACRAPEDNAEHGTKAFMRIWDTEDGDAPPLFSGWMFAESPALSAMDHPRYDLWVMSCTTSSGDGSTASR